MVLLALVLAGTACGQGPSDDPAEGIPDNLPGALTTQTPTQGNGLRLESFTYRQQPSGTRFFSQWFGEVRNAGSRIHCLNQANLQFEDQTGHVREESSVVYGNVYVSENLPSVQCLGPGELGVLNGVSIDDEALAAEQIRRVQVQFESNDVRGAAADPAPPTLSGEHFVAGTDGEQTIAGALTAGDRALRNLHLDFFLRGADGFYQDWLFATRDDLLLAAGEAWQFETVLSAEEVAEYDTFIKYEFADEPVDGASADSPDVSGGSNGPVYSGARPGSTTLPGMNDAYSMLQDGSVFCVAQQAYVSRVVVTFHTRPGICAWSEDVIERNGGVLCSRHPEAVEIGAAVTRVGTSPVEITPGTYQPIVSGDLYVALLDASYGPAPSCTPGGYALGEGLEGPFTLDSVTFDTISDSLVTGSIDIRSAAGEQLSGSFTAPNCPVQQYVQASTCGQHVGSCISSDLFCVP